MRLISQLNALIWSWGEMFRALARGAAVLPLALYGALQALVLLAVVGFAYPPLSAIVAPALRWRFGDAVLHYPNNFFVLRSALGQVDTFLWVLLGAALSAASVHIFAAFFAGRREGLRSGWSAAARRYLPIVLVAAVVMVLTHVIAQAPTSIWGELADRSPSRFRVVRTASIAVVVAVQSLFLYAVPYLMLTKRRVLKAVSGSFSLAWRHPVTTYLLVGIPAAVELIPLWLSRNSAMLAQRLSPEFLVFVMFVWIVAIFFAGYAVAGSSTRFFMYVTQDDTQANEGREG